LDLNLDPDVLLTQGSGALASWRYEFLLVDAACALWACVLWAVLPDSPPTARGLSRAQRLMAVARLRRNQTGVDAKVFKPAQVREAFLGDPKTVRGVRCERGACGCANDLTGDSGYGCSLVSL
jgi:hypothetical protein